MIDTSKPGTATTTADDTGEDSAVSLEHQTEIAQTQLALEMTFAGDGDDCVSPRQKEQPSFTEKTK